MSLAIWSLAAQNVLLCHFGPWRHKMFHCTLWSLRHKMFHCTLWPQAAQNVSLYLLVPGGTKCFIVPFGPWRNKTL